MTFLAPLTLFGLAAVSIPIAIHFFFRTRYRTVACQFEVTDDRLQHRAIVPGAVYEHELRHSDLPPLGSIRGECKAWPGDVPCIYNATCMSIGYGMQECSILLIKLII